MQNNIARRKVLPSRSFKVIVIQDLVANDYVAGENEMKTHIEKLRNAFAITYGNRLAPGVGAYGVGGVAIVMPDKPSAQAWLDNFNENLAKMDHEAASIIPVGDPWNFMRRASGEGLAGIEGANKEAFPERFMFMVRVEEAGAKLPTVLSSITQDGWDVSVTRTGVKYLEHAEVLHWQRFDIVDRVSGLWGQQCPFRGWIKATHSTLVDPS